MAEPTLIGFTVLEHLSSFMLNLDGTLQKRSAQFIVKKVIVSAREVDTIHFY